MLPHQHRHSCSTLRYSKAALIRDHWPNARVALDERMKEERLSMGILELYCYPASPVPAHPFILSYNL